MQGNYRHYHLAAGKPTAAQAQSRFTPQQVSVAANECNGLPTLTSNLRQQQQPQRSAPTDHMQSRAGSHRQEPLFASDQQQQQYSRQHRRTPGSGIVVPRSHQVGVMQPSYWPHSADNSSNRKSASATQNNNNAGWKNTQHQTSIVTCQQQQYYQSQPQFDEQQQQSKSGSRTRDDDNEDGGGACRAPSNPNLAQASKNNYASQLRNSQLQYRFQQQQHQGSRMYQPNNPSASPRDKSAASSSSSSSSSSSRVCPASAESRTLNSVDSGARTTSEELPRPLHVNFNRSSRASGGSGNCQDDADDDDAEENGSRKKKYLTAKYGQQQMNLIKKRLKIEMWLYEQLKELTKDSKSEAELDEIDIDLDELLDMEDDDTRRHWLQKTLAPFEDVQLDRINKFIDQVLEQSKLL